MGDTTRIAWTDHTWNPWIGCVKISPGCKNCYAERLIVGRMGRDNCWGPASTTDRNVTSASNWRKPYAWHRAAMKARKPAKVFCGSLMDWAEDHPQLDPYREKLWQIIRETPWLHWQLLTKRADRIAELLPSDWRKGYPNVWLGTSIENMDYAHRADDLRKIPAVVRFISYEPALGPLAEIDLQDIHWLIVGGESGPGYREMPHDWAREMKVACERAGTAFFFKQSSAPRTEMGIELDGSIHRNYPTIGEED
jgi:protein gp37